MREVSIAGIGVDTRTGKQVLILKDEADSRGLFILVSEAEAEMLILVLDGADITRPLTHELMHNMVEKLGYELKSVQIESRTDKTYMGRITITDKFAAAIDFEARAIDAVILALRARAPILVDSDVMDSYGLSFKIVDERQDSREFKRFINDVKASDFKLPD